MVFLRIVIVLAVLIIILLSLNLKLYLKISDTATVVRAGIGPIVLKLIPQRKKKIKLKDYTYKSFHKRLEKEKKKAEKKKNKKNKKKLAAEKKKNSELKQKAAEVSDSSKSGEEKLFSVSSIIELVTTEFPKLSSRLHINIKKLSVTVGGDDAANIAITYGRLEAVIGAMLALLDENTTLKPLNDGAVSVQADFLSPKTKTELDISVKISVLSILKTAFAALVWLIKSKSSSQGK